uniref:Transposase n=1 Tax=Acrobeloides nanus TaxID=290746 RepID=A0A914CFH3_9BILA
MWRAYANLDALPPQYNHLVVNHGVTFVDRQIGAHTQSVESKNGQLKEFVRRKYGIHDEPFTSHLREFAWRERFGDRNNVFYHLWSQISMFYPCIQ